MTSERAGDALRRIQKLGDDRERQGFRRGFWAGVGVGLAVAGLVAGLVLMIVRGA